MRTRYPRYKSFDADRMLELLQAKQRAAAQNASDTEDPIEQLRRNLGGCNDPSQECVECPWDRESSYCAECIERGL